MSQSLDGEKIPWTRSQARIRMLFGVLMLLVFGSYTIHTWFTLNIGMLSRPGAGLWPLIIGFGGVVVSIIVVVEGYRTRLQDEEVEWPRGEGARRALIFTGLIVSYVGSLWLIGFLLASILTAAAVLRLTGEVPWWRGGFYALLMVLPLHYFFTAVLLVRFPPGLLFDRL